MSGDDEEDDGACETESVHPLFRDEVSQRIYACAIMMGRINNPETSEELRKAGFDLIAAVIRSIAAPESRVRQIKTTG